MLHTIYFINVMTTWEECICFWCFLIVALSYSRISERFFSWPACSIQLSVTQKNSSKALASEMIWRRIYVIVELFSVSDSEGESSMRCISSTGIIYLFIYLLLATNLVFNKCTNQRQAAGFCNEWFSMLSVGSVTSHEPSPHAPRSDLSHLVSWGKLLSIHCSLLAWLGQGA